MLSVSRAMLLALCALPLALGERVHKEVQGASASVVIHRSAKATGDGKAFLSVMTWNVEKLDGKLTKKTDYVNDVIERVVSEHRVDVILLQEVQACNLVQAAMKATGMSCVESVVSPRHEADMSFTVLGGLILYSKALFTPAAGSLNRAMDSGEWSQWVGVNDPSVNDKHGKTLKTKWEESCTWSKYKSGKGCKSIRADIPVTNSIKLYLNSDAFGTTLRETFANGLRLMNIHLFSGGRNKEISDRQKTDRRTFQMRSLFWMNKIWNFNDEYNYQEPPPTTIYAGDFNTQRKSDIDQILAPSLDYGLKTWKASDSLRTHASGQFLDHVVLSSKPSSTIVSASTEVYDQVGPKDSVNSDHNPMVVKLYASKKKAPKPSGPQIDWASAFGHTTTTMKDLSKMDFPALGEDLPPVTETPTTTSGKPKSNLNEEEWPTIG